MPAPQPAKLWITCATVFVAAVFVWLVVEIARNADWPWYAILLFGVSWLGIGLSATWAFVVQMSTRWDLQGVSQLSHRGVIRLRWQDISEVTAKQMGLLVLSDGNSSVSVLLMAYDSPRAVESWIRDRLAEFGRPAKP